VNVISPRLISAMRPAVPDGKSPASPRLGMTTISPSASPGPALISGSGDSVFWSGDVSSSVVRIGW
jgi:hypothetical protein